ncbi:MAG: M20/M25/M40 family metallo-hydrolase [Rhodobacteraceae bacterium]|nr:M20/M25/M40 family metallo-hydrolase [Paracoccaceae bacterium]
MRALVEELMLIPGLAGHEGRVAAAIRAHLDRMGLDGQTDRLGNLIATVEGDPALPSVMVFAHMDQLGFVVRKVEADGLLRLERVGGVPERALAAQAVLVCTPRGDLPAVIGNKSHHATGPEEKYRVVPYQELAADAGFASRAEAEAAGVRIGDPVVYLPRVLDLAGGRIAGTALDDRAGCAVLLALADRLTLRQRGPTVHLVWSVQEEFNLRGVLPAVRALAPDIAFQIDLVLACDTPDMAHRGEVALGAGPAMSLYSFHGRGTLNGLIPHPALVRHLEAVAEGAGIPLQRSAHTGALTETAYVQLEGEGIACLDLGFPMRYSHSALEVAEVADLEALVDLLDAALAAIDEDFTLERT